MRWKEIAEDAAPPAPKLPVKTGPITGIPIEEMEAWEEFAGDRHSAARAPVTTSGVAHAYNSFER